MWWLCLVLLVLFGAGGAAAAEGGGEVGVDGSAHVCVLGCDQGHSNACIACTTGAPHAVGVCCNGGGELVVDDGAHPFKVHTPVLSSCLCV